MTTPSSNGYMIRLEVLKMAQQIAEQEYLSKRDDLRLHWETKARFASSNGASHAPAEPDYPGFPTPDSIKAKATELYSFITTK